MLKQKNALLLLTLLSLGVFYNYNEKGEEPSLSELNQAIIDYCHENDADVSVSQLLDQIAVDAEQLLQAEKDLVERALKREKIKLSSFNNSIKLLRNEKSRRLAHVYKGVHEADLELVSQRIYELESNLRVLSHQEMNLKTILLS